MEENNHSIVVECRYHNGNGGLHTPISKGGLGERPVAIGIIDEKRRIILLTNYLPHVANTCRGKGRSCVGCDYAKFYIINKEKIEERNGRSKEILRYEMKLGKGESCTYEHLKQKIYDSGFSSFYKQYKTDLSLLHLGFIPQKDDYGVLS
jgi:hypothetical protein